MSLRIVLDGPPSKAFCVNTCVPGHVELDLKSASQRASIDTVNLTFVGQSKIRIARRERTGIPAGVGPNSYTTRSYSSQAVLFSQGSTLTNPSFEASASRRGEDGGILTWPFEVRIPAETQALSPEAIEGHHGDIFHRTDPFPATLGYDPLIQHQPLPDSLPEFFIPCGFDTDASGSVRYKLHADVPGLSSGLRGLWIGNKDTEVDVPVVNPNLAAAPLQLSYNRLAYEETIHTLRLLPSHVDGKLSFRERSRSIFKKSSLPSLGLRMTFTAPDILFLDQPEDQGMPFSLNVLRLAPSPSLRPQSHDEKGQLKAESEIPTPQVFVKKFEVSLVAFTVLRTSETSSSWNTAKRAQGYMSACIFSYKPKSKDASLMEMSVGEGEWFNVGERLGVHWGSLQETEMVERFGLVGDFATPNLVRSYGLEWDIKLEVAGEEARWETRFGNGGGLPVRLVNGDGSTPTGEVPQAQASTPWSDNADEAGNVAPPMYDEKPGKA